MFALDGNTAQRSTALAEFERGGTLLLCLEDRSWTAPPYARHVIFAHAIVGSADRVRRSSARPSRGACDLGKAHLPFAPVVANTDEEDVWRDTRIGDDAAKDGVDESCPPFATGETCRVCSNGWAEADQAVRRAFKITESAVRKRSKPNEAYVSLVAHRMKT